MSVAGEVALVGAPPGDGGPGPTADFAPEGDAVSVVTRDIAQRYKELWGNWRSEKNWSNAEIQKVVKLKLYM